MKLLTSAAVSLLLVPLARVLMVRILKKVSLDVLLSIGFLALSFPTLAFAYGEECLSLGTPTSSPLTSNSTYSELSWKASLVNNCSEPLKVSVTFKVFNSGGFELDSDIAFGVIIASNGSVDINEIMLVSPASKIDLISSSSISLTSRKYEPTLAEQCLRIGAGGFREIDSNSTYNEISLKTEVINDCSSAFKATVYFSFYDKDGFLIDYDIERNVYSPPNSMGAARSLSLLIAELVPRFSYVKASLSSQQNVDNPYYLESGRWIDTPQASFDAATSALLTSLSVDGTDMYSLKLSLEGSQFRVIQESILNISSLPAGSARYNSIDNSLRIPALNIRNYPGIDALENVVLKLSDITYLLFDLASYEDVRSPNSTNAVEGAGSCLSMSNLDYFELSSNSTYTELSWKATVNNVCSTNFTSTLYFYLHDSSDLILDYDIESSLSISASRANTITGRILVSPPELASEIAKLSTQLRIQ